MLVRCSECGKQISDLARTCPNCGAPIGANGQAVSVSNRKRLVALFFAIILGLFGVHNAYLGYKKKFYIELTLGIVCVSSYFGAVLFLWAMPFLSLLFMIAFFVGIPILFIVSIVETLSYKVDSDGNILGW